MIHALLENTALLVILHLLLNRCWLNRANPDTLKHQILMGCALGGLCFLSYVCLPVQTNDVSFDAIPLILSMAGLFGGWAMVLPVMLIKLLQVLITEGVGLWLGISSTVLAVGSGLLYRWLYQRHYLAINAKFLASFGILLYGAQLILQPCLLPDPLAAQVLKQSCLPILGILPVATLILGRLLKDQYQYRYSPQTRDTEAHLRAIGQALPDVLVTLDRHGHCQWLNAPSSYKRSMTGTPQAILPLPPSDQLDAFIRKTLASQEPQRITYHLPASERFRFFEGRAQRIHTRDVQNARLVLLIRETTEQVQAEAELRIAAIAFESRQGMIITDPDSRILRVNHAFCRITGFTPEEVIGQSTRILRSGENPAELYQTMWQEILKHGSWQGEIQNRRRTGETYPAWLSISAVRDPDGSITHYVAAQTDISARKAAENQIHHLAFYDPLTGLPNRRLLLERLLHALSSTGKNRQHGALMIFDLDNFKNINDLHGHQTGDQFLCEVAARLTERVRPGDTVARLGGDEFVIVLTGFTSDRQEARQQLEVFGQRILECLRQPYHLDDLILHSSASIGVVMFRDTASDDIQLEAEELIRHADISMYEAKVAGKNSLRFFDPHMQEALNNRLSLEEDLRHALEHGEFLLNFQPQFNEQWQLVGAETLVRWKHPKQGILLPGAFIEVAKRTGLVPELDLQVLQQACQQLAQWAKHPLLDELVIAVNISASLLYQSNFVERLLQMLADSGANPHQLKLEITEALLLDDMPLASQHMLALRQAGIRFSIDDFGTGYSSMIYLHRLPLDQLKIDQTFIQALPDDQSSLAIIRAICALADSLNLEVLAEGVESMEQVQLLTQLGCHHFQGYLLGHPVSAGEFESLTRYDAWPAYQLHSLPLNPPPLIEEA